MFNEIDDTSADSVEFILVNRGSGSRDLEKRSKNGNLWVTNGKIFFAQYADDAHIIHIGRYIRMANPNLDIGVPYILKCEPGSIANLLFDSTFKGSWLQTRSSAVVCRCQLPIFTEFGCV